MSNVNVVRTAVSGANQTSQYLGLPVKTFPNSTLNQKLNINKDLIITAEEKPSVRYVGIGNGGHDFIQGGNGRKKWLGVHHKPRHTALYNQLPFVLRRLDEDLTPEQRLRYRLRRIETHHGESYVAYYLRVLDLTDVEVGLELRTVKDGVTTARPYLPSIEDLNPVPPALVTGQAVTTTGDYIASTAKVKFHMSPEDVEEFINAVRIIENEDGFAVISEMCTVSGVDRSVTGDFNGNTASYLDVVGAQISSFITSAWIMEHQADGITMTLDVGNVEPLQSLG